MTLRKRLQRFCFRLATLCLVAGLLLAVPVPETNDILQYKNAVVVLFGFFFFGKLLIDTFFFDRYI